MMPKTNGGIMNGDTKKSVSNEQENEFSKRQECVRLHEAGSSVTVIANKLDRTRPWVYKWIDRFSSKAPDWYHDQSKSPNSGNTRKTSKQIKKAIIMIREALVRQTDPNLEYSFIGAIAIHQELHARKIQPLPALSTINRILKEHNLTRQKPKSERPKSNIYYPGLIARHPNHRHEVDLVTPRYIKGYGKIVSVNRIDAFSSHVNLGIFPSKGTDTVIEFFVIDWKDNGIPDFLQMDNEAAFRGGMYYARSFGKLIRFCLNFGVQIIFIPWKEPWRNPLIENFNGHFNRLLWLKKRFNDDSHLRVEAKKLLARHNQYQEYRKEQFSKSQAQSHTLTFLPKDFRFDPETELPITHGKIHFIRLVRENGQIEILNESFILDRQYVYEYVWATIDTVKESLSIYHQASKNQKRILVKELNYKLREKVCPKIPVKNFISSVNDV